MGELILVSVCWLLCKDYHKKMRQGPDAVPVLVWVAVVGWWVFGILGLLLGLGLV